MNLYATDVDLYPEDTADTLDRSIPYRT